MLSLVQRFMPGPSSANRSQDSLKDPLLPKHTHQKSTYQKEKQGGLQGDTLTLTFPKNFPKEERNNTIQQTEQKARTKADKSPFGHETVKTKVFYENSQDAEASFEDLQEQPGEFHDHLYKATLNKNDKPPFIQTTTEFFGPVAAAYNEQDYQAGWPPPTTRRPSCKQKT